MVCPKAFSHREFRDVRTPRSATGYHHLLHTHFPVVKAVRRTMLIYIIKTLHHPVLGNNYLTLLLIL